MRAQIKGVLLLINILRVFIEDLETRLGVEASQETVLVILELPTIVEFVDRLPASLLERDCYEDVRKDIVDLAICVDVVVAKVNCASNQG